MYNKKNSKFDSISNISLESIHSPIHISTEKLAKVSNNLNTIIQKWSNVYLSNAFNTWKGLLHVESKAKYSYDLQIDEDKSFPKFKIKKGLFDVLVLYLNHNANTIIADPDAFYIRDSDIKRENINSFQLINNLFNTMSLCKYSYTNTDLNVYNISFVGNRLGQIVSFYIKENKSIFISEGSFLCGTPNIDVVKVNIGSGLIIGNGINFVKITCKHKHAMVWANSYGNIEEHRIMNNKSKLINYGHIFSIQGNKIENVVKKTSSTVNNRLFGINNSLLEITGPVKLYTQTGNKNKEILDLKLKLDK